MRKRLPEATQTQRDIEDLTGLLAGLAMDHYTRYLVDEHLRELTKDAEAGALAETRRDELEELEGELDDLAWRIRGR